MSKPDSAIVRTSSRIDVDKKAHLDVTYFNDTVEENEKQFNTSAKNGLKSSQISGLRSAHGENRLTPPPTTPWYVMFFHHLTGFFSLLLWIAAALCFIAYALDSSGPENLYLGIVLSVVVFMTGVFSYYQDAKSAAVMEGFRNMLPPTTVVIRDGQNQEVEGWELVPGDLIVMNMGEKIPADIRVVYSSNFKVDNSSLTGEPLPLARIPENTMQGKEKFTLLEATNMAFYGTNCKEGNGRGLVVETGDNTAIGKIAKLATSTENIETPIAEEINSFIKIISYIAVTLGVTFLIIGFFKGIDPVANLVFAIGIIVANVPEGLLATVTVSLTLTAQRMARKYVMVKNLESVETLGSTTVIASDKTGTLTQNKMTAAHVFYNQREYNCLPEALDNRYDPNDPTLNKLRLIAALNNNANFATDDAKEMAKPIQERKTRGGNESEAAMLKFAEYIENVKNVREKNRKIAEIPFNSANKYAVSIHALDNSWDNPRFLTLKGAPERVYNRCSYVSINGEAVPITDEHRAQYQEALRKLMNGGERVLGFAYLELDPNEFPEDFAFDTDNPNFPIENLVFTGLISVIDPPRPAVPGSVLKCQQAGIKVMMVTGDHPDTAEAIAKQVNIIRDRTRRDIAFEKNIPMEEVDENDPDIKAIVVTGGMIDELGDLDKEADNPAGKATMQKWLDYDQVVFARTSPKQKLLIVEGIQAKTHIFRGYPADNPKSVRHVVAVTGDGVNDSPALKAANIGVAMGIAGTEVAKDAADMILLNDNFASIVDGVEEGRLIFDNLKKSIAYTLSSNIPEISPFLVFILVQIPLPLPTVLILCIDLGTDMIPAISLAYEQKEANIMFKPPRDMNVDRLVTTKLISFSYLQIGIIQAVAGFFTYFVVLNDYGFPPSILPFLADDFKNDNFYQSDGVGPYLLKNNEKVYVNECNIQREGICHTPEEALAHAQCAFFISIIVVQWADLVCCKTRSLSLKQQGMRNGMLNFGLVFETVLGILLCYIPALNTGLGTRPLSFVHWCIATPFTMIILSYDEVRKFLLRNLGKGNWFERNTYY